MSIYYKSLLIFDKEKQTARKIVFQPGINIVTSKQNSVGKTSLSLMLLYSFGAKVKFSDKWNLNNIFTKLTIEKDSKIIEIIRHKDTYSIIADGKKFFYPIQSKGYSEKLYELLGLTIKIKDKNSDTYSTAVPSLYLLPYFISQTDTNDDRSVFEDLNMYKKKDLHDALYYHVGALDNEYSTIIHQFTQATKDLDTLKKAHEKQKAEIEYLEEKLENHKNTKSTDCDADLDADIAIYEQYSRIKQNYYTLVRKKAELKHKIHLLNNALIDNTAYTAKLLENEDIICPVCNSDITDFISSALKIGIAESDINAELADLKSELLSIERKIVKIKPNLDTLQNSVQQIDLRRENVKITRAIIVWNEELTKAKASFGEIQLKIDALEETIKRHSKSVKTYKEKKSAADSTYRTSFSTLLTATNISTTGIDISKLGLYDTITLSGSEIPRVAIAKFFALLESRSSDSIIMPIIFDFPNLDMTEENLLKCFKVMCEKISDTETYPQSFVFSINCEERIAKAGATLADASVINLETLPADDPEQQQLLCKHDYVAYAKEINQIVNT